MSKIYKLNSPDGDAIDVKRTQLCCSYRLALALIGFLMFFHLYAQRVGMSVAIICMVNHTAIQESSLSSKEPIQFTAGGNSTNMENTTWSNTNIATQKSSMVCSRQNENKAAVDGPFAWDKSIQGHILGAYFYGYLVSQIPGGLLAEQFGGKWVLVGSLGLASIATVLTPLAAYAGHELLICLRVIVGIGSGALFPAMHAILGQWAPPLERSMLCGLTYAGSMMGNVFAFPISGVLCQYGFAGGWGSIFYLIGISSIVTIIAWMLLTSNTPAEHRSMSDAERKYIMGSLKGEISESKPEWRKVPWLEFLKSGPVWALVIGNFCTDWGLYTYLTNIPTFYKEILFFDIASNGLLSALPFVGLWATMTFCPILADILRSKKILSTVTTRKLFTSIGLLGAGAFLLGLSYIDCSQTVLAVAILTLAVTISGCVYSGYFVNHMDIAPQYAGTLMGISNGISASAGFLAPYVAAQITKSQTRESWQIVFFIAAGVYAVGAILYCLLASGEIQPWAVDRKDDDEQDGTGMKFIAVVEVATPNGRPIYNPRLSNGSLPTDLMLAEEKA